MLKLRRVVRAIKPGRVPQYPCRQLCKLTTKLLRIANCTPPVTATRYVGKLILD